MTTGLRDRMAGPGGPITAQDMVDRGKLFTLEDARRILSSTEPLTSVPFQPGSAVSFAAEERWAEGIEALHGTTPVPVHIRIGSGVGSAEHRLSKDAVLSALKPFGMSGSYALRCPGPLLEQNLNYWYGGALEKELQLLTVGPNAIGQAVTRETMQSFSNLEMLDRMVSVLTERYAERDLYVDMSKLTHSLRKTFLQIVVPAEAHTIRGSGADQDDWWMGIQLRNSQTAELQTAISGYFYRPICTNGMIDSGPTMGTWSRRSGSDVDEVYAWAEHAVNEVLGGFEHTLEQVRASTTHDLSGDVGDVVRDVFENYDIPARAQSRVIDALVEDRELTAYSVVNALTWAANDAERPEEAQRLMMTGGELVRHHGRCDSCRRLLT